MEEFKHILTEPGTWVAIAFFIFVALIVWKVFPILGKGLDQYSEKIKKELEEAAALKNQAEKLLKEAEKKASSADRSAQEIIERAKFEAKLIADEAEKEIEREIERKMILADEKIERAKDAAVEHVRTKAVDNAIAAAVRVLGEEFQSANNSEKLVEKSLRLISSDIS